MSASFSETPGRWLLADLAELADRMERDFRSLGPLHARAMGQAISWSEPPERMDWDWAGGEEAARSDDEIARMATAWRIACLGRAGRGQGFDGERVARGDRPEALAWAWSELDDGERALARALRPDALAEWLASSFEPFERGPAFRGGARDPSVAPGAFYASAALVAIDPAAAPLRRAARALALGGVGSWPAWAESVEALASVGAWGGWRRAKEMAEAFAQVRVAMSAPRRQSAMVACGAGAMAAGGLAHGLATGALGAAAPAMALAGLCALCAGMGLRLARGRRSSGSKATWGGLWSREAMAAVYPDLEESGMFAAWGRTLLGEPPRANLAEGLALAGLSLPSTTGRLASAQYESADRFGADGWSVEDLRSALAAKFESMEISKAAGARAGAEPARARRI